MWVDTISPQCRSEHMRRIRSKGMEPELTIRRLVHRMGYRFRLHKKELPGRPDLVFASRKKVIFVHGCFWHQHKSCKVSRCRSQIWNTGFRNSRVTQSETKSSNKS